MVGMLIASIMGYRFLDTGSMYRAIAWYASENHIDPHNTVPLEILARTVSMEVTENDGSVFVDGIRVPLKERRGHIDSTVSLVAKIEGVRKAMVEQQRIIAGKGNIVLAGRDIGTVVVPHASIKLYLDAPSNVRASRRYKELKALGQKVKLQSILEQLEMRDKIDVERTHSPLRPAHDAHIINTEGITIAQVLDKALDLIKLDH